MSKVLVKYIWLLIFHFKLTLYHDAATANSLLELKVILPIFVILALIFTAIKSYNNNKAIAFAIGWFFIALMPFSNIIPLRMLMAERYIYLASFAFCLAWSARR